MREKRKWIFIYRDFVTGGNETLILRIARHIVNEGSACYLICETVSSEMVRQIVEVGANILKPQRWSTQSVVAEIPEQADVIMTFRITTYFLIKNSYDKCKVVMYCVHPDHLTFFNEKRTCDKKIKQLVFNRIIKTGTDNGTILYMDDESKCEVEKKYHFPIPADSVYFLPFEKSNAYKCWKAEDSKTILTICRADFPFKSYVLGLVDAAKNIYNEGINLKLKIISYGKDLNQIIQKKEGLDYIELIGEVPYQELEKYYLAADIYVGMGTTILDAARIGIPAIVANVNSPQFMSAGFFHEKPRTCAGFGEGEKGEDLLRTLLMCEASQLKKIGDVARKAFEDIYSMDKYISRVEAISKGSSSTVWEKMWFKILKNRMTPF